MLSIKFSLIREGQLYMVRILDGRHFAPPLDNLNRFSVDECYVK